MRATPCRPLLSLSRAIVLGDPDPVEGVVEIPIVEKEVQSHQSHYKVSPVFPQPPLWPGRPSIPSCLPQLPLSPPFR